MPTTLPRDRMVDLTRELVKALVDRPDDVLLTAIRDENRVTLRVHVAPGDLGKVIGKQGRTARSLRTILSAVAMKEQCSCALDIAESDPNQRL